MSFILLSVFFLLTGFLTGIFAGMLGIGGGLIFVPILYLLLPFTPIDKSQISYIVIGTSLFSAAIASISSAANHFFRNNVDKRKGFYLALGSITSSIISTFIVINLNPFVLQMIFAVVFILIAAKMLTEGKKKNTEVRNSRYLRDYYGILFGLAVGIFAAFTGLGGGILFVPVLSYLMGVEFKKAIGTSSLVISVTGAAAAIAYAFHKPAGIIAPLQFGYVYLIAGLPLALGAAAGAYFGVKIVLRSQAKSIKKVFSALLIIAVIKILFSF